MSLQEAESGKIKKLPENLAANRGRGRPPGSQNKTGLTVKETILAAADGLGGHARMIKWAKESPANERIFWGSIYPKLLPLVQADVSAQINILITKTEGGF